MYVGTNSTFLIFDSRGGSRRVAKFLQESILITFDLIWKVLLSDRNFANPSRSASVIQSNLINNESKLGVV